MLQIWKTQPGLDPAEQAKDLIKEINVGSILGIGGPQHRLQIKPGLFVP